MIEYSDNRKLKKKDSAENQDELNAWQSWFRGELEKHRPGMSRSNKSTYEAARIHALTGEIDLQDFTDGAYEKVMCLINSSMPSRNASGNAGKTRGIPD